MSCFKSSRVKVVVLTHSYSGLLCLPTCVPREHKLLLLSAFVFGTAVFLCLIVPMDTVHILSPEDRGKEKWRALKKPSREKREGIKQELNLFWRGYTFIFPRWQKGMLCCTPKRHLRNLFTACPQTRTMWIYFCSWHFFSWKVLRMTGAWLFFSLCWDMVDQPTFLFPAAVKRCFWVCSL